uniref:Plant-specific domain TIGR01615 family protein n=1 Tax=Leersia perrieri TaxID=77586 RepID=A0A0D9VAW7_9ORYZ
MMLLGKEFGLSPPPAVTPRRRAPARVAPWTGGSPVGDLWLRTRGASGGGGAAADGFGSHSHESDMDLAMLVSDFLENGSSGGADSRGSSDSESGLSDLAHLADMISMYKQGGDEKENELLSMVHSLLFSIHESELLAFNRGQCSASCIRHLLVKLLRYAGYDSAVCVSKWQGFDKIPGGDHEYIDVMMNSDSEDRLIIDIDFRSHFEIARAVDSYGSLLNSLPVVYVGTLPRLKQFLHVMVDAAKWSLKQNSMPLPPWRSLPYLQAKWHSKYERIDLHNGQDFHSTASDHALWIDLHNGQDFHSTASDHALCIGHLKRLKSSLQSELDTERLLMMPIKTDIKRRAKFERRRRSLLRF